MGRKRDKWELIYIDTKREAKQLCRDLLAYGQESVFDTEICAEDGTPTTQPNGCQIVLSSYCFDPRFAFVVRGELYKYLGAYFTSEDHKKIGHNLLFDFRAIQENRETQFEVKGWYGETLYMAWLMDCENDRDLGLKSLLSQRFGIDTKDFDEVWAYLPAGAKKKVFPSMWDVLENPKHPAYNRDEAIHYSALDAWGNYILFCDLEDVLKERGYFQTYVDVDRWFLWILWLMEKRGIRLDMDRLARMQARALAGQKKVDRLWQAKVGSVNRKSPLQLADLFFRHKDNSCGCDKPHNLVKDPNGRLILGKPNVKQGWEDGVPSTNAFVIEHLAEKDACHAAEIIEMGKKGSTLLSTFVNRFLVSGEPEVCNGVEIEVAHTSWNAIIRTGRTSGRKNDRGLCGTLQNLPRADNDHLGLRYAFVARPGYALIVFDYGQIELCMLAHLTEDPTMIEAFRKGIDIHGVTACRIYKLDCDPKDVKKLFPEQRTKSKEINFGIPYGMSAQRYKQSMYSKGTILTLEQAQQDINDWFAAYPQVKRKLWEWVQFAKRTGYAETIAGRVRYIPHINLPVNIGDWDTATDEEKAKYRLRKHAYNTAQNTPIQGSAADLIKKAQVDLFFNPRIRELVPIENLQLLQVHDELVMEAPIAVVEEVASIAKEVMANAMTLKVPVVVDGSICYAYGAGK